VGRGLCLVADEREFACFTADEVEGGRALARTTADTVVGLAPDRVDRVTIHGYGPPVTADVVENVYAARIDDVPGSDLEVTFSRPDPDGCRRTVTSDLLSEVALLRDEPRRGVDLPQAAHDALRHWQLDAVVEEGARYWGGERAVDFWAVPVVPRGRPKCAPASRVCIVAVGDGSGAAQCMLGGNRRGRNWWLGGPRSGRSVIFGTLPDGVRGVRVRHHGATVDIHARGNVFGGLLPFSFRVRDVPRVELLR
jgi:hypothetical protein